MEPLTELLEKLDVKTFNIILGAKKMAPNDGSW